MGDVIKGNFGSHNQGRKLADEINEPGRTIVDLSDISREELLSIALQREVAYIKADRAIERGETMSEEDFKAAETAWQETAEMLTEEESASIEAAADKLLQEE